ncbi:MAG TPA: T9SS type A sorting domain-containing protein [Prolixibacteraceae bacterium]
MKKHLFALVLSFVCLTATAQRITLGIHQDYQVPDIPIITQTGDTLRSSSPIGNQWFKDGVELPGENNQKLVIVSSGNYNVGVILGSGCSSESTILNAIKTDVSIIKTADFTCKVFPNPNNGMFTVELESDKPVVFELELFTSNGESVAKQTVNHPSGNLQIPFGKASLADGVYYLQIKYGSNILSRQIIVN